MSTQQKKRILSDSNITSRTYKSRTDPPMYITLAHLDGREPEERIIREGIAYDQTDHIELDLEAIPEHVRNDLAKFAISLAKEYFSKPGNEERYQEWLKERKKHQQANHS